MSEVELKRALLREAERSAVLSALDAMDDLATEIGYAAALDATRYAYRRMDDPGIDETARDHDAEALADLGDVGDLRWDG